MKDLAFGLALKKEAEGNKDMAFWTPLIPINVLKVRLYPSRFKYSYSSKYTAQF